MVFPIHSRLFVRLGNFFPEVCLVQERANPEGQDAAGQPVEVWSALAGHEAIGCRVSPAGGNERRSSNQVIAQSTHVVMLAGAYVGVTPRMRAVVGGQAYDILLAETDGNGVMTKLFCEVIRG